MHATNSDENASNRRARRVGATAALAAAAVLLICVAAWGHSSSAGPASLEAEAKCDAACHRAKQAQAAAVAKQMKELRDQIMNDFKSTTHYGKEVGKIPKKTESIRDQVMDGSLVGSKNDGPPAPPPFKPKFDLDSTSTDEEPASKDKVPKQMKTKKQTHPALAAADAHLKKARAHAAVAAKHEQAAAAAAAASPHGETSVSAKSLHAQLVHETKKQLAKVVHAAARGAKVPSNVAVKPLKKKHGNKAKEAASTKAVHKKAKAKKAVHSKASSKKKKKHKIPVDLPTINAKHLAFRLGNLVKKLKAAQEVIANKSEKKEKDDGMGGGKFLRGYFGE